MHYIAAAWIKYEPQHLDDETQEQSGDSDLQSLAALSAICTPMQTSAQTREAISKSSTPMEALAILERMHYGEVKNARNL